MVGLGRARGGIQDGIGRMAGRWVTWWIVLCPVGETVGFGVEVGYSASLGLGTGTGRNGWRRGRGGLGRRIGDGLGPTAGSWRLWGLGGRRLWNGEGGDGYGLGYGGGYGHRCRRRDGFGHGSGYGLGWGRGNGRRDGHPRRCGRWFRQRHPRRCRIGCGSGRRGVVGENGGMSLEGDSVDWGHGWGDTGQWWRR